MTYEAVLVEVAHGRRARHPEMSRGWYVYKFGGTLYAHNPFHGDGPSGRDHVFRPNHVDIATTRGTVE